MSEEQCLKCRYRASIVDPNGCGMIVYCTCKNPDASVNKEKCPCYVLPPDDPYGNTWRRRRR